MIRLVRALADASLILAIALLVPMAIIALVQIGPMP
jgi:hypothetical protein